MKRTMLGFFCLVCLEAGAARKKTLEGKLDDLHIPDDKVTPVLSRDQLHIVNTRYSGLRFRHEFSVQGAHNFTAESHLRVQQGAVGYRFHLTDRWSLGLRYTSYSNDLTGAGRRLFEIKKVLPDTDFALDAQEAFIGLNTIYGKLRWSKTKVVYFDQYIALGGGRINLASGPSGHGLVDAGVVFWLGKHASLRLGARNEFYNQIQKTGRYFRHNTMGYLEAGFLLGSGVR